MLRNRQPRKMKPLDKKNGFPDLLFMIFVVVFVFCLTAIINNGPRISTSKLQKKYIKLKIEHGNVFFIE